MDESFQEFFQPEQQTNCRPDLKIAFLLFDKFTLHPVAELIDPIRFAADEGYMSRQDLCHWEWMTWDNQQITTSSGLPILPTMPLNLDDDWDYVVLAGGLLEGVIDPPDALIEAMHKIYQRKIPIITLDSSSFVVAKAGLLNGKRCAIHFTIRDEFKQRFPHVTPVLDKTYLSDGGIISCPGGTSIELAIDIVRRHCGDARASKVMKYLMTEEGKKKSSPQGNLKIDKQNTYYADDIVERAMAYLRNHMPSDPKLPEVTSHLQVTLRQLNQAFLRSTGDTAALHWRKIRLSQARRAVVASNASIYDIAISCGFSNASHLIKLFRKHYGETPANYRKRCRNAERLA